MSPENQQPSQPRINVTRSPDYRDSYANSVQVRISVWDFFLYFGTAQQDTAEELTIKNFQGIYLSPQQAKALWNVLGQNLAQYEQTFGNVALEPQPPTTSNLRNFN
jgi:flagellar protein FlaG